MMETFVEQGCGGMSGQPWEMMENITPVIGFTKIFAKYTGKDQ